ncbi:hypothetical protein SADUNF_Sadunf17G0012100 [Salix dunnii]|uniref:BED-type domain-containing protein n=1 Tax=Salix dunnii TaxID=1413687 RepID=A0A835MJG4_9ROSI|nr:hypothetical protein SADUNF_Sadunf17G0012100 [Salix dunnii]
MAPPLVDKLMECAKAIEDGELKHADSLFREIGLQSSTEANLATRKAVKYFAEALVRRLYQLYPKNPMPLVRFREDLDILACKFQPFLSFASYTCMPPFYDALRGKKQVHIIDFSVTVDIWQHATLMKVLANELGSRLLYRITFVGPKLSRHLGYLKLISLILSKTAENNHIDFEYEEYIANSVAEIVGATLQLGRKSKEEAVVVEWEFELHKLLAVPSEVFNLVMSKLKDLKPEVMVIVEQEADHNSPDLVDRLTKSFKYYSVMFASLEEDTFEKLEDYRVLWERIFRRQISKVVAAEGVGHAERHETWAQWRDRLFRAGFHPARILFRETMLFNNKTNQYRIEEKNRRPLLCRLDYPFAISSAWKPDLTHDESLSMEICDLGSMLGSFNIAQDASRESGKASNSVSHEDDADDDIIMMKGNIWSKECLSINQVAASAEIFDILEYVCHVHDLPMALTWISDRKEDDRNARENFRLHIVDTACFVNDVGMKGFFEACVEGPPLEEGQGVAGKALQSKMQFVPDVADLDVIDYPLLHVAWEFGLHAVLAIKLASTYMSSVDYILELVFPLDMREISEQLVLMKEIILTLTNNCGNSWRLWGNEVGTEEAGKSDETTAIVSGSSPQGFSDIGGFTTEDLITVLNSCLSNGHGEQEQARTTDITLLKTPHWARPRKEGTASSNKLRSMVWKDFDKLKDENGAEWAICKHCKKSYRGESTRGTTNLRKHLKSCPGEKGRKAEQETPKDQPVPFMSSSRKQQGNSEHQIPRHQAGPFKVIKSTSPDDLKLINYIFNSSLDESEIVVHCNHNYLTRSELCTLRPQTCLDDNIISIMSDALTLAERKKKGSRNWYLPICFAEYAYDTSECISFARKHMFRENYMSALFSCEKMYVPVFDKERSHFYLYVLHIKKQVVEIWDSLAKSSGSSVDNRLPSMLATLDILFEDDIEQNYPDGWSFTSFSVDRSPNVPQQTNGYDCGVYVIKFMLAPEEATQPDFDLDSDTERLDVVLRLLDGNVNSYRTELVAKAEATYYLSPKTNDSLRIYVQKMDEETENKFSMLKGNNANAIEDGDLNLADSLIKDVLTDNDDKLVKYFVEALVRRVYRIYPKNPRPLVPSCTDLRCNMDYLFFPFFWFTEFTTRSAIADALTGKKRIQVIDFSLMASGRRWCCLLEDYVKQSGDAVSFHLTIIGPILSRKGDYLNEILEKLPAEAKKLPIEFEVKHVAANTPAEIVEAALKLERSSQDETIVVRWEFELYKLLAQPGATESVLSKLKELKPEIMIVVEQEASLNGQDFLECFSNSIRYYSIVFDSLDNDNFDHGNHCKVLWEMYFRRQISNLVAQQNTDQIVRHETFAEWRERLFHSGFRHVRLQTQFKGTFFGHLPEYHIEEKNRHPVLYRRDDPLLFTSAWKPDPTQPNSESLGSWNQESSLRAEATIPGGNSGPPILAGTVSSSFLDDQPDDPHLIIEGNVWYPECFSINQIAASAEIFDMMEYICHVHYLPLALTWMSDRRVLHLEKSASYLNDFTMVEFMEACGEHHLEEGKGVAGKALQLNSMYFVSDISKLDVKDYPFIFDSWEFGLHEMKEISAQRLLVNEILSILQKNSRNSWRVCNEELSRANICSEVEIMAEEVGTTTITPAAIPASQPLELSENGSLNSSQIRELCNIFKPPGDEVRVPETHDQEVEQQNSIFRPAADLFPEYEERVANGEGHLTCGNPLMRLEKMEKYGPNAEIVVKNIEGKAQGEPLIFTNT